MTQTPARPNISDDALAVLRGYAAGDEVDKIVKDTGRNRDWVIATLRTLCGLSRNRAETVLTQVAAPARSPAKPGPPVVAAKSPTPTPTPTSTRISQSYESLLTRAEETGVPRLTRLVNRIRELAGELRNGLAIIDAERETRERIARLEQELAEARAVLRGKKLPPVASPGKTRTRTPRPTAPIGNGPPARVYREWAQANGIACPAFGRIPTDVVKMYNAQHNGTNVDTEPTDIDDETPTVTHEEDVTK